MRQACPGAECDDDVLESTRHAAHADILREGIDGRLGVLAENREQIDEAARAA